MTTAKTIQFAKLAGLAFGGQEDDGEFQWIGTQRQFQEFRELQA